MFNGGNVSYRTTWNKRRKPQKSDSYAVVLTPKTENRMCACQTCEKTSEKRKKTQKKI